MSLLAPGSQLGPYEILTPIGVGGQGEVYSGYRHYENRIIGIPKTSESRDGLKKVCVF